AVFDDLLTVSPRLRLFFTEVGYEFVRRTRNDVGLLISLASANYHRAKAFVEGDKDQRATDIVSLNSLLSNLKEITSSRKLHIDGVYDKMLYRLTDNDFPLRLLPPYDFATENEFEQFRASIPNGW
uniref:hypothetical protein n=1 Tax=Cephaloticoccus sp. TaxID=1985742 RepID=UPI00404A35E7